MRKTESIKSFTAAIPGEPLRKLVDGFCRKMGNEPNITRIELSTSMVTLIEEHALGKQPAYSASVFLSTTHAEKQATTRL